MRPIRTRYLPGELSVIGCYSVAIESDRNDLGGINRFFKYDHRLRRFPRIDRAAFLVANQFCAKRIGHHPIAVAVFVGGSAIHPKQIVRPAAEFDSLRSRKVGNANGENQDVIFSDRNRITEAFDCRLADCQRDGRQLDIAEADGRWIGGDRWRHHRRTRLRSRGGLLHTAAARGHHQQHTGAAEQEKQASHNRFVSRVCIRRLPASIVAHQAECN